MILDTAFVIDLMDGDTSAMRTAAEIERDGRVLKLPSMTVLELYIGVGIVAESREEERSVRRVIDSIPVVRMDDGIARRAGRLIGRLRTEGITLGKGDAVIGATALVEEEPVLTRNVRDFERIPGLVVERY